MKRMRYQPWVGLPNILAGEFVVPEFLQQTATAENLAQAMGNLVSDRVVQQRIRSRFRSMHQALRQDTASRVADAVIAELDGA